MLNPIETFVKNRKLEMSVYLLLVSNGCSAPTQSCGERQEQWGALWQCEKRWAMISGSLPHDGEVDRAIDASNLC